MRDVRTKELRLAVAATCTLALQCKLVYH